MIHFFGGTCFIDSLRVVYCTHIHIGYMKLTCYCCCGLVSMRCLFFEDHHTCYLLHRISNKLYDYPCMYVHICI